MAILQNRRSHKINIKIVFMKGYEIGGIQQIGIGVSNLREAWNWYIDMFGMDCRIFEDEAEAKLMLPYTGGKPRSRHAVLALNLQSGGGFEIWQYKGREPEDIREQIRLGDLGILACKIKVKNISDAFSFYKGKSAVILGEPVADPAGNRTFFLKDPYDNIFQIVEGNNWFLDENKVSGGAYGAVIGVSDIDRARKVYSDILGYDIVVYDLTHVFPDLSAIPGGGNKMRRVLLRCSKPFSGHFIKIFGQSEIELICSVDKPGKKIYHERFWGDPGFIHLCFDIKGMEKLREFAGSKGHPFTVDSKASHMGNSFDMGEAAGHFAYIEDPDGTLIEFVETHKMAILKKLNWYLDLKKKSAYKPLPTWMLKMLKYSRVRNP